MRFRRLDLIRYGIFTDRSLDLPAGQVDFHLICGLNEAGKSTARDAVDDLLFGFGLKTQYDFRFDMSSLRVGGELERDNESLAFQRKKGNKDTLRDPNDQILPDASLVPFLGDADRDFFGRISLHDRATCFTAYISSEIHSKSQNFKNPRFRHFISSGSE